MMKLGPAWRNYEIQTLNSGITGNLSWDAIADLLPGRSVGACQARLKRQEALKLNLKHRERVRGGRVTKKKQQTMIAQNKGAGQGRGGKPWTREEDALLKELLFKGTRAAEVMQAFPHRSAIAVAYRVGINWSKEGGGFEGNEEESEEEADWDADERSDDDISPRSSPTPSCRKPVAAIVHRHPYAPTAPDCQPSARNRHVMVISDDNGKSCASETAMSIEAAPAAVRQDFHEKQKNALDVVNAKLAELFEKQDKVMDRINGTFE